MNNKWIYALFGVLLLGGLAFAISGATVGTEVERGRWSGNTSGSVVTEGGNVSGVNISASVLTEKWASFYGDATGAIVLADSAANQVYAWTWSATNGGEVCLSTNGTYDFSGIGIGSVPSNVDSFYGFATADADSGTNTLTENCTVTLYEGNATGVGGVTLDSGFQTCGVEQGGASSKADLAFCTDMNSSGANYEGVSADYEIMVPTDDAASATETYYFFVELN